MVDYEQSKIHNKDTYLKYKVAITLLILLVVLVVVISGIFLFLSEDRNIIGLEPVKETVYLNDNERLDSSDLRKIGYYYFDVNGEKVYYLSKKIKDEEDVSHVKEIKEIEPLGFYVYDGDRRYATDSKNVFGVFDVFTGDYMADTTYQLVTLPEADPDTFEPGDDFSKDKNHVYIDGRIVKSADPQSFMFTQHPMVSIDKDHLFLSGIVLPEADPDTYEVLHNTAVSIFSSINEIYIKDKDNVFSGLCLLEGVDEDSVVIESELYAKDVTLYDKNGQFSISRDANGDCSIVRE